MPEQRELLQALLDYHSTYTEFIVSARNLDFCLTQAIRHYCSATKYPYGNMHDRVFHVYVIGRVFFHDSTSILEWLGQARPTTDHLEEVYKALQKDKPVKTALDVYRKSYAAVTHSLGRLRMLAAEGAL